MRGSLIGLVWGGAISLALLSAPAHATFIGDMPPEPPNIDKLFLVASDNLPNFSGDVGGQTSGVVVNALANVDVMVANGWSTIKPDTGSLTSITFTPIGTLPQPPNPAGNMLFDDFSLRGQIIGCPGHPHPSCEVDISVTDSSGVISPLIMFTGLPQNADISRIGAISADETIASLTISTPMGESFKEVKQIAFSFCSSGTNPACGIVNPPITTPEPATLAVLGSALAGFGVFRRRRRN
jgi:PEP-CTERM motif